MLNIDVNRSAQGVERYFDRELAGERLLDERAWRLGGARSGEVRTPWFSTTVAIRVALLRNENPTTGKRLTVPKNTRRR
jgi:hypothetical protein